MRINTSKLVLQRFGLLPNPDAFVTSPQDSILHQAPSILTLKERLCAEIQEMPSNGRISWIKVTWVYHSNLILT